MPKVKLLVNSWKRTEKDEEGNKVKRRYRKGDVIDVTTSEARTLLRDVPHLGPVAEEDKATEEKKDESRPAQSSGTSNNPTVKK